MDKDVLLISRWLKRTRMSYAIVAGTFLLVDGLMFFRFIFQPTRQGAVSPPLPPPIMYLFDFAIVYFFLAGINALVKAVSLLNISRAPILRVFAHFPEEIAWIYAETRTPRGNWPTSVVKHPGIEAPISGVDPEPIGTTSNVLIYLRTGKRFSISVPHHQETELLSVLARRAPQAAVGYNTLAMNVYASSRREIRPLIECLRDVTPKAVLFAGTGVVLYVACRVAPASTSALFTSSLELCLVAAVTLCAWGIGVYAIEWVAWLKQSGEKRSPLPYNTHS